MHVIGRSESFITLRWPLPRRRQIRRVQGNRANLHQLNPTMNTFSFRPCFISTLCLIGAAGLIAPRTFAAPPPVTVTQPVQVQVVNTAAAPAQVQVVNPVQVQGAISITGQAVQVQGSVETLNDAVHQPFNLTLSAEFGSDGFVHQNFYIPAGKRLVIETVTVEAAVPAGQKVLVRLEVPNFLSLAVQSQGVFSDASDTLEHFVGTHPVKVRVDSPADPTQPAFTITAFRGSAGGTGFFYASVAGYLVDL